MSHTPKCHNIQSPQLPNIASILPARSIVDIPRPPILDSGELELLPNPIHPVERSSNRDSRIRITRIHHNLVLLLRDELFVDPVAALLAGVVLQEFLVGAHGVVRGVGRDVQGVTHLGVVQELVNSEAVDARGVQGRWKGLAVPQVPVPVPDGAVVPLR